MVSRRATRRSFALFVAVAVGLQLTPRDLQAQVLWNALDAKPRPNLIIAYDVSVTMQIAPDCNPKQCHAAWRGSAGGYFPGLLWNGTRLRDATAELIRALPLFKSEFLYGGFRYDTCGPNGKWLGHSTVPSKSQVGMAEISYMTAPDQNDPDGSYQHTWDMVNDIGHQNDTGPAGPTSFQACEHAEGATPPGGNGIDPCNIPWYFRANVQNAICASYDPFSTYPPGNKLGIGRAYLNQPDNVVNGGCRENALMFFTDGLYSSSPGVAPEGQQATASSPPFFGPFKSSAYYSPLDQVSNAFVFLASKPPAGWPQFTPAKLAAAVNQPTIFPATDQTTLYVSFAEVANRLKRGVFTPGNPALDPHGSRLASVSLWVPGMPKGNQPPYPDQSYFGRPSRLSWWPLDPQTGARGSTPICETDWTSRAGYSYRLLTSSGLNAGGSTPPADVEKALGPPLQSETWYSGSPMFAHVADDGTLDRGQGTGTPVSPDSHGFDFGYMLNAGPTQPVVVEAPADIPPTGDPNFALFEKTNRGRERTVYTMAGGYLFGFRAGLYQALTPPSDVLNIGVALEYTYDDSSSGSGACKESFRYLPSWVVAQLQAPTDPLAPGDHVNRLMAQSYTAGQISVRESKVASNGNVDDYATVLVMTQGKGGPWMSALDITDPNDPAKLSVLGEWSLPNASDTTSAEPALYSFPAVAGGQPSQQTVVVMPGGDGGSANLYSYVLRRSGVTLLSQAALPAGNYPSDAVCFDGLGRGSVTDCVVLSDAGVLVRVPIQSDGTFGTPVNLYPQYAAALGASMTGEKFYTHPAVYFTADGSIAYFFGSGDVKSLAAPPAVANNAYKVVDAYAHNGAADGTKSCRNAAPFGTSGIIPLATSAEIITSPPVVSQGVVSFTSYSPSVTGCSNGSAYLYAMNFETCVDATNPASARPLPTNIGSGIPMSPLLIRQSGTIVAETTTTIARPIQASGRGVGSKNQARRGYIILYWRGQYAAP